MKPLQIVEWAHRGGLTLTGKEILFVRTDELPVRMKHSTATGQNILSNGKVGVDMINLKQGEGFVPHTHPGDHILIVVAGEGTITYGGSIYETQAGYAYLIDGQVPHAVGAITDHTILAFGAPHMPVDSWDRMQPVEYQAVTSDAGTLFCRICKVASSSSQSLLLHDVDCPHCPCADCVGV